MSARPVCCQGHVSGCTARASAQPTFDDIAMWPHPQRGGHRRCADVRCIQQGFLRQMCIALRCLDLRVAQKLLDLIDRPAVIDQQAGNVCRRS